MNSRMNKRTKKFNSKKLDNDNVSEDEEIHSGTVQIDNLPNNVNSLRAMLKEVKHHISNLEI